MRRASFLHTQQQMRDGNADARASVHGYSSIAKDVTRRLRWEWAKPGMYLMAVSRSQGITPERSAETFGVVEILEVRREPLLHIGREGKGGVLREGFTDMLPFEFMAMFIDHMGGDPDAEVARVAFRHVDALRVPAAWDACTETQQHELAKGRR